jgi:CheY-like chemotaxis protein
LSERAPIQPGASHAAATPRARNQDPSTNAQAPDAWETRCDQTIGQLVGGIAHDFNNALTTIFGYASMARDLLAPDHTARPLLEQLTCAAQQAAELARALMTFTRKTSGARQRTDLRDVARQAARLLRRLLPAGEPLAVHLPDDTQLPVIADSVQLQQVLLNLAAQIRDPFRTPSQLSISAARDPQHLDHAVLEVARENLSAPTAPTPPPETAACAPGLDLATLEEIVREHGGCMTVDATSAERRVARIALPLDARPAADAAAGPAAPPETLRGDGAHVLLAEDDEHVRRILVSTLRSRGYAVTAVEDGAAFVETCLRQADQTAALIADFDMPREDGQAALARLRQQGIHTHAILMTARIDRDLEAELDEHTTLLEKPFQLTDFVTLVGRLAHGRSENDRCPK